MKTGLEGNTEEANSEGREKRREREKKGGEDMRLWRGTAPETQRRET